MLELRKKSKSLERMQGIVIRFSADNWPRVGLELSLPMRFSASKNSPSMLSLCHCVLTEEFVTKEPVVFDPNSHDKN